MDDIVVPWMVELGLVSWRTVHFGKRPPLPSELLASFIIFGGFSLIPDRRIRLTLGWGLVVASALNLMPSIVSGPTTSLGKVEANPNLVGPVAGRQTESGNSPFYYGPRG